MLRHPDDRRVRRSSRGLLGCAETFMRMRPAAISPAATTRPVVNGSPSPASGGSALAQHDQEHARRFKSVNGMRDIRGHQHDRLGRGANLRAADHQAKSPGQRQDERIERRRVFGQLLPGIEREECDVSSRRPRQHTARNSVRCRRHERFECQQQAACSPSSHLVAAPTL